MYMVCACTLTACGLKTLASHYYTLLHGEHPVHTLIGQKRMFHQSKKHRRRVFYCVSL